MAFTWRWRFAALAGALPACGGIALSPDAGTSSDAGTQVEAGPGPGIVDASSGDVAHDGGPTLDGEPSDEGPDTTTPDGPALEPCAPVVFTPPQGNVNYGGTPVTLSDPSVTGAGGTIYCTIDGTNPTENSPVYTAPIVVSVPQTIRALGVGAHCIPVISVAAYTVGGTLPPWLNPVGDSAGLTFQNDFLLNAQHEGELIVCYTLDGTTPTCANGVCTGASITYSDATQIPINGSLTSATTGQVTVSALTCSAFDPNSIVVTSTYTLQASPPTMTNPAPSTTLPADAGTLTPTIQSQTVDSVTPANPVGIHTSTSAQAAPSCTTTPALANGATVIVSGSTSIQAITCKSGYLPSAVATFDYAFAP